MPFQTSRPFALHACLILGWLTLASAFGQVPDVTPAFPNNITGQPGTLLFRQVNLGRVTNIAYHNGHIYTHEVATANPRRWRFTDIHNVTTFTNELTGGNIVGNFSDHGTHGHYKVGDWLGGQFAANVRRVSPGVNVIDDMPGFVWLNGLFPLQPGDELTRVYYPWGLAFNWLEYGARTGNGYLFRGTQPLAEWPALAQHGVAGNSILLGNLLFITSDESNMGILCYDISPVFNSPPQPPQLLDKLSGSVGAYIVYPWEHYLVLSRRDTNTVDIVDFSDPTDLRFVTSINITGHPNRDRGNGLGYVQCQDNFIFTERHKIDMDTFETVLELDEMDAGGRPAGSVSGELDTSQHLMPMGNLLVSGGYSHPGADGVGIWVHQEEPDRKAPYVGYHIPRPGQTNFPLGAPISLLIHENLESYTIVNGASVILRPVGGSAVDAIVSFSYDDVLTITPTQYLEPDTTYEVEIVAGGIKDVAGNGIVGYSFSFSTGSQVEGGNASPQLESFNATPSPTTPGSEVTFTASATDADAGDTLEYRFTFGETHAVRDWDASPTAVHTYATAGHYGVKVQVRDLRMGVPLSTISHTGTVTVAAEPPVLRPTKSSPIALDAAGRRIWVVNPDNDSVSVLDADTRVRLAEYDLHARLGISGSIDPRNVAIDANGNAWVSCRDADRVAVLSPEGHLLQNITVGYGSAPMGVATTPDGNHVFVTLESRGQLRRFDAETFAETGSLTLGPMPRAIAITANGSRVLVTRFISTEDYGQVYDVDANAMELTRIIPLHRDRGRDGFSSGRGVPNYVGGITIAPAGDYAYFTAIKSNTQRGTFFDNGENTNNPLDPDNTVRAMIGRIDLVQNREPFTATWSLETYRVDVDNSDSPTSIEFSPRGDYIFVSIQGNNHVAVFDDLLIRTQPQSASVKTTKGRFATGLAPQGLVFDAATNRLFSADFMGRSVTVHDMGDFFSFGIRETNRLAVPTITTESLPSDVLLGKRIFYQAADASGLTDLPTMSLEGYISCASCHVDGQHDGMTWDFTDRGEGLRNTTDLRGRGGMAQGNVHWSGNFDEIQDFVLDVVNAFGGGEGLLPAGESPHPSLGTPNAGRSEELDALAAYVSSLGNEHLPRSPHRNADGSMTASAGEGRDVFLSQNCASCHSGPGLTDSTVGTANLHPVGTLRTSSGQRLNGPLTGIDTPGLRSLWSGAPYFHDGSAKTLEEVFRVAGGILYQAEDGARSGGAYMPGYPTLNEDSSMHGQMVFLRTGQSVTFEHVNGGQGGIGDLELRWMPSWWPNPGSVTVTVNGTPHNITVTPPPGLNNPLIFWMGLRLENVPLEAGPTNILVITTSSEFDSGFDDLLVTTADDRLAATAHRRVASLHETQREHLLDYLLQLDGSDDIAATNPTATIALSAGQASSSTRPYAEFDITFSEPVSGLSVEDFLRGGSANSSASLLMPLTEGMHYRLRVAGFSQAGTVTIRLPAGAVQAQDDAQPNLESNVATFVYTPSTTDSLAALSDEFTDVSTQANWQLVSAREGWGQSKLETWNIDTSRAGHMRLMPYTSSWFQNWTGEMAFKEVTGDFVATLRMQARRRNGLPGRPTSSYSLGGIMARAPQAYTNASPTPDPGSDILLPWPPPAFGQPNHYTTPWLPGRENYIFLSFGYADAGTWGDVPNTWYCEVKTTENSYSELYAVQNGIPADTDLVTLQMVRIGSHFAVLRRHGENGPWIIENRYERSDMPETLQLGITTYTDWDSVNGVNEFHHNRTVNTGGTPDLVVDADYFRLRRPGPSITPNALQILPFTDQDGSLVYLEDTDLDTALGDHADTAHEPAGESFDGWLTSHLTPGQLVQPSLTSLSADADGNGLANGIEFALGIHEGSPLALELTGPPENRVARLTLTRNTNARGITLLVESTEDFETWTPLATSVDGASPTGIATMTEGPGAIRAWIVETPVASTRTFYRARVITE